MPTSTNQPSDFARIWWNDQDICRTRLFDAISLILPVGEQFVIDAVSAWVTMQPDNLVVPSQLQQEARRFVREEVNHQRAHRAYNHRLSQYQPVAYIEQRLSDAIQPIAALPLQKRLLLAAALEYLTALFSVEILRNNNVWLSHHDCHQARMWRWHCTEEIHHHHICLDILKNCNVTNPERFLAIVGAAMYLVHDVIGVWFQMCKHDLKAHRIRSRTLILDTIKFIPKSLPTLLRIFYRCRKFFHHN
jgi:uncharacterized protein